jgi:hypothetical protein
MIPAGSGGIALRDESIVLARLDDKNSILARR